MYSTSRAHWIASATLRSLAVLLAASSLVLHAQMVYKVSIYTDATLSSDGQTIYAEATTADQSILGSCTHSEYQTTVSVFGLSGAGPVVENGFQSSLEAPTGGEGGDWTVLGTLSLYCSCARADVPTTSGAPANVVTITQSGVGVIADSEDGVLGGACNPDAGYYCDAVVGQQIMLTGSPAGGTWYVGGTNWAQYSNWPRNGPAQTNLSSNPVSFFWAEGTGVPGDDNYFLVTYAAGGNTAIAGFTVEAPSWTSSNVVPAAATLQEGGTYVGSVYNPSAIVTNPPDYAGTTTFVQTVNGGTQVVTVTGAYPGCNTPPCTATCQLNGTPPLLDTSAPYPNVTQSSNGAALYDDAGGNLPVPPPAGYAGLQQSGYFTSYAFWTPSVSGTAFPVPLGVYTWSWSGAVTWSGTSWVLSGAPTPSGQAQATTTYPGWNGPVAGYQSSCPMQQGQ